MYLISAARRRLPELGPVDGGEAANRARLVEINPLFHYLDILRAPMIGEEQQAYHWYIVIACTLVGWALTILALKKYRARVPYWV